MDKDKKIQGGIEHYLVLYRSGEYNKRKTAEKIRQLFKVKLPENPYKLKKGCIGITDPSHPRVLAERYFNEALQQVKELNMDMWEANDEDAV